MGRAALIAAGGCVRLDSVFHLQPLPSQNSRSANRWPSPRRQVTAERLAGVALRRYSATRSEAASGPALSPFVT
jgi:hypothetical protein